MMTSADLSIKNKRGSGELEAVLAKILSATIVCRFLRKRNRRRRLERNGSLAWQRTAPRHP